MARKYTIDFVTDEIIPFDQKKAEIDELLCGRERKDYGDENDFITIPRPLGGNYVLGPVTANERRIPRMPMIAEVR